MGFREWLLSESAEPKTKTYESPSVVEVSYDDPNVMGYIHAEIDPDNPQIYRVNRVKVSPEGMGHGKRLYQIALELATKRGAMLAPAKVQTSDKAIRVWNSLYRSSDTEKTPLSSKDWGMGGRHNRMMGKYPGLRYSDPSTHPPKDDSEWWSVNSGYRAKTIQQSPR
jgi:hypothetical protein